MAPDSPPRRAPPLIFHLPDDEASDSDLSDVPASPTTPEHVGLTQAIQAPSTPDQKIIPTNLPPQRRGRLVRDTYIDSDTDSDLPGTKRTRAKQWRSPSTPTPTFCRRKQAHPSKAKQPQNESLESDADESDFEVPFSPPYDDKHLRVVLKDSLESANLAPIEKMPTEIIERIGIATSKDIDHQNLSNCNRQLKHDLSTPESVIWRERFLALYDAPMIRSPYDFFAAYRERNFVLNNAVEFLHGADDRLPIQLEILFEMVVEAYNPQAPYLPTPETSRNLQLFAGQELWMRSFLCSPFYNFGGPSHGTPEPLFDNLQLTFSYLLFSPKYRIANIVTFSRDDYAIAKVYNWGSPLGTIFERLPESEQDKQPPSNPFPFKMFPNLRSPSPPSGPKPIKYTLNTHVLLHIRNFFHRHLIHDPMAERLVGDIDEDTFWRANKKLTQLGHIPRQWSGPLHKGDENVEAILNGKFVGFYSSVLRWPKTEFDLQEIQSAAQDWSGVDPLTLNFNASTTNVVSGAFVWPEVFASFPCFASTVPSVQEAAQLRQAGFGHTYYIQGSASFLDIEAVDDTTSNSNAAKSSKGRAAAATNGTSKSDQRKYHPYNALRLRGVIHPIPSTFVPPTKTVPGNLWPRDSPVALVPPLRIPGYRRLVMVLFKPTTVSLIRQLEYADENFGSTFGVSVTDQISQHTAAGIVVGANGAILNPEEVDSYLKKHLQKLIQEREGLSDAADKDDLTGDGNMRGTGDHILQAKGKAKAGSPSAEMWSLPDIVDLERQLYQDGLVSWEDIEYAYAYEGVLCPGGNVMLGRWWRCGLAGTGVSAGGEVDVQGVGVPDGTEVGEAGAGGQVSGAGTGPGQPGGTTGAGRARTLASLERGPFVFWGMNSDVN